jgi:hypothetical protein
MDANAAALWQAIIGVLSLIVLTATLITLILYTKYTYRMQQAIERQVRISSDQTDELVHQRRLSILPAFVTYPLEPRQGSFLHLNNIGNGVAIKIQVEHVPLQLEEYLGTIMGFNMIASLRPTNETTLSPRYEGFGTRDQTNLAMRNPRVQDYLRNERYTLQVKFYDIEGNAYTQSIGMDNGRCAPEPVKLVKS